MTKDNWFRIILSGSLVLILAACNQAVTPNLPENTSLPITATEQTVVAQTGTAAPIEGEDTQMTPSLPTPGSTGMQYLVEKAKEDLAQRLSISVNQIDLIEATAVVWPNSSLGCPQPGMVYAEVLTPGYLILLNAGSEEYEYHTSRSTEVIYCENPDSPVPGTPDDI
jgi:hypothetical protein